VEKDDDGCICQGSWRAIVKEYKCLIGSRYVKDSTLEVFKFFGLVHDGDDYYYGMVRESARIELLSCVMHIEDFGYTLVERVTYENEPQKS
jgi:hypothetical protein